MIEGIHDRDGYPIREHAKLRVRYPSQLLPGREVSFLGWVAGVEKRPVKGEERDVVRVRVKSGGERIALPEHCRVRRATKAEREQRHRIIKRRLAKPKRKTRGRGKRPRRLRP